jgi:fatty acid desaturase
VLAPNRVNYHLEHHLFMTIPHYKLPKLHRMLRERGILKDASIVRGYRTILRQAGSATAATDGPGVGGQTLTFG